MILSFSSTNSDNFKEFLLHIYYKLPKELESTLRFLVLSLSISDKIIEKCFCTYSRQIVILLLQVLNETALEMQRDFIPALNREMSQIMGHLTFDRYSKVSANDKLQLNLEVPETYELIPVSRLSGGTIDQVYFSMRIAAIRLLEKGRETLPIFLDEPFAQYDENRTRKAFELLKEISGERQIFFFTCREREFELAKEVFGAEINRVRL